MSFCSTQSDVGPPLLCRRWIRDEHPPGKNADGIAFKLTSAGERRHMYIYRSFLGNQRVAGLILSISILFLTIVDALRFIWI